MLNYNPHIILYLLGMKSKVLDVIMKVLVGITIFLGIFAIFRPDLVKYVVEYVRHWIQFLWYWNYVIIFFSSLIETFPVLGVVVPGQNIMIIVGWFFGEIWREQLIYSIIIASIWAVLWNYIGYFLGIYYGKYFFEHYWMIFGLWKTEVRYLEKWIKKWWPFWVIAWKFHNLSRAFIPFIAGTSWMKKSSFFLYNTIGSIVRAVSMILLGVVFAKNYETIIDYIWYFFIGILLLFIWYIYFFKKEAFMKYIEEKNKEIDEQIESSKKK